jgi:carbon-monoxide dehydrogenase medium subunit
MKSFTYHAPESLTQALTLLAAKKKKSRLLAGGTDLLVQMRRGLHQSDHLIDVKRIPELNRLTYDPSEGLTVGAAVTCAALRERREVKEHYPALFDAVSLIGGTAIQNRATLGGNLCNAAPSADTIPAMIVLQARCTIEGSDGKRTLAVEEFCKGPGETVLGDSDILLAIHFPPPPPRSGGSYLRFIPRSEMDIAVAGAGVWVKLGSKGESAKNEKIAEARIALGGVAPTPLFVQRAGEALNGASPDEASFQKAAEIALAAVRPISDARGTEAQRRHLAGVMVKRALRVALERAREAGRRTPGSAGGAS